MFEAENKSRPLEAPPSDRGDQSYSVDALKALAERRHVNLPDATGVYTMLLDLWMEAHMQVPEETKETLYKVSLGFGFLAYDKLPQTKQILFLGRLQTERNNDNLDHLELSSEQATILRDIAGAVNIPYEPGDETTPENRIFSYATVESRPPQLADIYWNFYGVKKPSNTDTPIVDSTSE